MEYANYPFDYMGISQRHDEGNHLPHWNPFKDYADKPWDEACQDKGRSYFIPQNDYIIDEVIMTSYSVRLTSVNKVKIPYKNEPDYLHLTLTHMEIEDLQKLKAGQIIKKGTKLMLEGDEGGAYGYHFHCTANLGKYYGIKKNSNDKYVFVYDKSLLPDEAFYVDKSFTNIVDNRRYNFKNTPIENKENDYFKASVKVFQNHNKLDETGIIDSKTYNKLKEQGLAK